MIMPTMQTIRPQKKHNKLLRASILALTILIILGIAIFAYFYFSTRNKTEQVLNDIKKQQSIIESIPNLETQANRDKFAKALAETQKQIDAELARLNK